MSKIIVIGSINVDINIKVDTLPIRGQTIKGYDMTYSEGGKGANQAVATGKIFGNEVTMLGCVGNDEFHINMLKKLKNNNVNIFDIKVLDDTFTGMAIVCVEKSGDNNIIVIPNANDKCDISYINSKKYLFDDCDYILLQNEIPFETIEYVVDYANKLGIDIIYNPAPAPNNINSDFIKKISFLTPNENELKIISGSESDDISLNAQKLIDMGAKGVVVTLGEKGVLYMDKMQKRYFEGRKVDVVNTVGAGDVFNGAFVGYLQKSGSVLEAVQFANVAAALSVTRKGTFDAVPTYDEIITFLNN